MSGEQCESGPVLIEFGLYRRRLIRLQCFLSSVSKTLSSCTSKNLQGRITLSYAVKFFIIFLLDFLSNSNRFNQTHVLLSTVQKIPPNFLNTLLCSSHPRQIQHISVTAGPITCNLCEDIYIIPMVPPQPSSEAARCEEHLFNLSQG